MGCPECLRLTIQFERIERVFESALGLLALSPITTLEPAGCRLRDASDKAGVASQSALVELDRHRRKHFKTEREAGGIQIKRA
jgi:hypothetical protein